MDSHQDYAAQGKDGKVYCYRNQPNFYDADEAWSTDSNYKILLSADSAPDWNSVTLSKEEYAEISSKIVETSPKTIEMLISGWKDAKSARELAEKELEEVTKRIETLKLCERDAKNAVTSALAHFGWNSACEEPEVKKPVGEVVVWGDWEIGDKVKLIRMRKYARDYGYKFTLGNVYTIGEDCVGDTGPLDDESTEEESYTPSYERAKEMGLEFVRV